MLRLSIAEGWIFTTMGNIAPLLPEFWPSVAFRYAEVNALQNVSVSQFTDKPSK